MRWKEQILNLAPYQPGKPINEVKKQYGLEKVVKLASNENPFGCSKNVLKAIQEYKTPFAIYPDGYAPDLRYALSEHLNVKPNQIILGNGSDNLLQMISRALLKPGTNTVMSEHTFSQYKHNAIIEGAEVREVPDINGAHDLAGMLEAIDENTNIVWVCSPNNPTGVYIPKEDLISFLDKVPEDTLVVLDEAYYEYVVADDYYDSIELVSKYNNLIVLRTFSKIYGLAAFRVGYGISNEKNIRALEPVREPFNVNSLAQTVAAAALKDQEFVKTCRKRNREGMELYYQFCEESKLSYFPSQANFILVDFQMDANEVFQYLLERGYIVRSGKALGFPTSIRITVGSNEQNNGLIENLKNLLAEKGRL